MDKNANKDNLLVMTFDGNFDELHEKLEKGEIDINEFRKNFNLGKGVTIFQGQSDEYERLKKTT